MFINKIAKVAIGLLVIIFIGVIVLFNLPKATIDNRDVLESISAGQLYANFSIDENKAEDKYLGKVVEIYGIVEDIYQDENNAAVVVLSSNKGESAAMITLDKDQNDIIEQFAIGDNITLKAQCNGLLMEVILNKGIVIL